MKTYQVYKAKGDGTLEAMGSFEGRNKQEAINQMAKRGIISGNEWTMKYIAIPFGPHLRRFNITKP